MDMPFRQEDGGHRRITHSMAEDVPANKQAPLNTLKILVVEDNLVNQKVVLALLKKSGYHADVAVNGVEALVALRERPYDLILMDINMPEMDGVEATQHIRTEWPTSEQPHIIAVTANAMKGDRERFLDAGMDDYVSKPIRYPLLLEALNKAVTKIVANT
ncbi:MAG: response regulator [Chloroflexota bacterium]